MSVLVKSVLAGCGAASLLLCIGGTALSQTPAPAASPAPASTPTPAPAENSVTALPEIEGVAPRRVQPPRRPNPRGVRGRPRQTPAAPQTPTQVVAGQNEKLDAARRSIMASLGAN